MASVAEIIAAARKQVQDSGNDAGPIDKLAKALEDALADQKRSFNESISEMEQRIATKVSDQIVDGQKRIREDVQRKGGFHTLDQAELYQRMIDPAGLTMQQKLSMPDYQLKKYVTPEQHDRIKAFQELNDDAMILGWIMAIKNCNKGQGVGNIDMKSFLGDTRTWKALQSVAKSLATGAAAEGAEWIPTQFSSQLIDIIEVSLKVASNYTRITIPANTFKVPIAISDDIAFLVAETDSDNLLDDANSYPKFTPGTSNQTFQAIKLAAIVVFSEEAQEDSIVPLLPFVRNKIANSMANAQERATLDGDTTGTHMDNDVTAATDARKAWMGLRLRAKTTAATTKDLGTLNLDNVRGLRELLTPAFAENPETLVYITSVKVMLKLLKFPEFLTIDKYGPRATVVTGEVGRIDGSPLQTSKYSRDDVSATGVNTVGGPNTKGLLYLTDRRGFWYGDRRAVRVDQGRMLVSGQGFMVISQRLDFKDIYKVSSTANKHVALGINIAA